MTWTGLPTQTLITAALVGAGVLLVLFFLRPRPQVLAVPSHVLWKQVIPRRIDPLIKEIIALLLQLLILAAVVGALGRPEPVVEEPEPVDVEGITRPRDRVVVVDLSASMGAMEGDASRLDGVKRRLQEMVADLADGERMAIVRADATATVAVPLTDDVQRLGLGIRSLRVRPGRADLSGALRRTQEVLADAQPPSEVRIFADSEVPAMTPPEGCAVLAEPVGEPRPNLAVTAFDLRATDGLPAQIEAFVRVQSYAPLDAQVTVSVETPTRVLGRATYDLPAGGTLDRIYHFYPPDEDRVEVVLQDVTFGEDGPPDALALDNRAYAFLPGLRPARVLLVSRGNQYMEVALGLIPGLKLDKVTPDEFRRSQAASGRYDVVFYDSFVPDDPPRVNSFFINPRVAVAGFSLVRQVETPTTTGWNLGHPLFANLVLRDLHVAVSGQFEPGRNDVRLINTPTGPIALARERGGVRYVAFGFDFADSDLPLRVAFPQLIFNTVLWMREGRASSPPAGPQHLARDPLWLQPESPDSALIIEPLPDVEAEPRRRVRSSPVGDGHLRHHFDRTGYHVVAGAEDAALLAVSMLDPVESDLGGTPTVAAPPPVPPAPEPEPISQPWAPPWVWLGLAALLLLLGEFALVNR